MKILKNFTGSRTAALAVGAMLTAMSATSNASDSSADWQFGLDIYGWFPSVSGNLAFSPPDGGGSVDADAEEILDDLKMVFMGSFEARKGNWSGFTDVIYLDLEGDKTKSVTVPDGDTQNLFDADLELKSWVWTLAGAYTVWQKQNSHLDLFAGARLLALDTDLQLTGAGSRQGNLKLSESENIWDVIVGAKGRHALNDRWFLPYYVDVGTGDSDLTWQASGGIGYSFGWGDVVLDYRYLEYDQGSDKPVQDLAFGGGRLGVIFRW